MRERLAIFGSGGYAECVVEAVEAAGVFDIAGMVLTPSSTMPISSRPIIAEQDFFADGARPMLGVVAVGEVSVAIAVSAAHRGEAFDACRFAIDRLKEIVPIWKKEHFEGGEIWVGCQTSHPSDAHTH